MNDVNDIKESREVVIFIAKLIKKAIEKNKDGKITKMEVLSIVGACLGEGVAAFSDITKVPKELMFIATKDSDYLAVLFDDVMRELDLPANSTARSAITHIWGLIHHIVETVQVCKNLYDPPKAEVVPE